MTLAYGETAARELSKCIHAPVADETALGALPSTQFTHLETIRVGAALWYFDSSSSAHGSSGTVVVPVDNPSTGRFLIDNPLGDVPATRTITATAPLTIAGTTSADLSADRTIAIVAATSSVPGSMSAADKAKIDLYPAISALTTGQPLRATGAATAAFGALDLGNASAVTGTLPGANVAAAVAGVSAGVVTAADQTHINSTPTIQEATVTLASGTATINTVITLAANSRIICNPVGDITGSTDYAHCREKFESRVNGGAGVASAVIEALAANGTKDADAAGDVHLVILTPHA